MSNPKTFYLVLGTAGISLLLLLHVLVVWCAIMGRSIGSRGSGTTHADEQDGHDDAGLSAGELVSLPCHDFKCAEGEAGGDCAVCLEAFEAGDQCRQLPRCEHSFHAECVDSWLRKSNACPVCRANVVDRPRNGESKVAASSRGVETTAAARMRSSSVALEIVVTER